MTTSELELATKRAVTLSISIAAKPLFYHGLGKLAWEDKTLPMIRDPGAAIVQITTSKRSSKASRLFSSPVPLSGNSPSSKLRVMRVTSIGDVRHGRSTELQAIMRTIEA